MGIVVGSVVDGVQSRVSFQIGTGVTLSCGFLAAVSSPTFRRRSHVADLLRAAGGRGSSGRSGCWCARLRWRPLLLSLNHDAPDVYGESSALSPGGFGHVTNR